MWHLFHFQETKHLGTVKQFHVFSTINLLNLILFMNSIFFILQIFVAGINSQLLSSKEVDCVHIILRA